ncbi:hypothetical protein [Shumkonia mesophila]|uniref:hypothetical protein n=1 Tax=Shumkonia mesophila TaxID=2838854 RepID=UPI00293531BA|nr:hypothetical protein [Shumkonia mesophila]
MTAQDRIIVLGKALVVLLERNGQEDVTTHWMAHYLAELMEKAQATTGPERAQAQREAADLILELWRHRTYMPGRYPLASFEPVFRTFERLSSDAPWYHLPSRPSPEDGTAEPILQWLERAEAIDKTSRVIIRHCLNRAIEAAAEAEGDWLNLLKELPPFEDEAPAIIRRMIGAENEHLSEGEAERQKVLKALDTLAQLLGEIGRATGGIFSS